MKGAAMIDPILNAGWPRPWLPWESRSSSTRLSKLKPVPWINGDYPRSNDWLAFPTERSVAAYFHRLCAICGEHMDGCVVFGANRGARETAGPGGHPRCLLLAVLTCPHLMEVAEDHDVVAWLYAGTGRGHTTTDEDDPYADGEQEVWDDAEPLSLDDLKALAKSDPLGLRVALDRVEAS